MAARSGSWSARLGPCSAPPVPAPWPHSTSGTCHRPARKTRPRPWASLARLLSHNPGLQRGQRQAFQGHGNMQFFKIEMKNFKKKKAWESNSCWVLMEHGPSWRMSELKRALKVISSSALVLQTRKLTWINCSGRVKMQPVALSSQSANPTGSTSVG